MVHEVWYMYFYYDISWPLAQKTINPEYQVNMFIPFILAGQEPCSLAGT